MKRYKPLFRMVENWLTNYLGFDVFVNPSRKEFKECGMHEQKYIGGVRGILYNDNMAIMRKGIHSMIVDALREEGKLPGVSKNLVIFDSHLDHFLAVQQHDKTDDMYISESYTKDFFAKVDDVNSEEYKKVMSWFDKVARKNPYVTFIPKCILRA